MDLKNPTYTIFLNTLPLLSRDWVNQGSSYSIEKITIAIFMMENKYPYKIPINRKNMSFFLMLAKFLLLWLYISIDKRLDSVINFIIS